MKYKIIDTVVTAIYGIDKVGNLDDEQIADLQANLNFLEDVLYDAMLALKQETGKRDELKIINGVFCFGNNQKRADK